jgi:hypothetical protein
MGVERRMKRRQAREAETRPRTLPPIARSYTGGDGNVFRDSLFIGNPPVKIGRGAKVTIVNSTLLTPAEAKKRGIKLPGQE